MTRAFALRAVGVLGAVALIAGVSAAGAATTYRDRVGDVKGAAAGPDLVSITVSHTAKTVTFRIRFAKAPPLRWSTAGKWVDMILLGIDVPPLGPRPTPTGWPGVDYFLGAHGAQKTVVLVKPGTRSGTPSKRLGLYPLAVEGATLSFTVPRARIGSPGWFAFSVAAAREVEGAGGSEDYAPASGTFRYRLTG